jgi:hypothetical protein
VSSRCAIVARGVAIGCVLVMACTTTTQLGSHDAAPRDDASAPPIACGTNTCTAGAVCCNESCGICTLPGATCIEIPCTDAGGSPCSGDDATLEGSCPTTLYRWNGSSCEALVGCSCSGRDCGRLHTSAALCLEEHSDCWDHACGTEGPACPSDFFCEVAACADTTGACVRSPDGCDGVFDPVVCGCDGAPYAGICAARRNGVSHDGSEACGLCAANVPTIAGACPTMLGFAWDGGQCAVVRGCSCTGNCERMYPSLEGCAAAREPCTTFACGDVRCARWDELCVQTTTGAHCEPIPGTCEGVPSCVCIDDPSCVETGPGAYVVTTP